MKVKKYIGDTIQDTIFKVKVDLGSDAIILDTRKFKKGGFLGFFGQEKVEVLAALEDKKNETDLNTQNEINSLKEMIKNLTNNVNDNIVEQKLSEPLKEISNYLMEQNVNKKYINEIIKITNKKKSLNKSDIKNIISNHFKKILNNCNPINLDKSGKVITFIGPTGVGKTTTIAKLAAMFSIKKKKDVCLITSDTYRIAAVQQLRTYSDIINIPLKVVYDGNEFLNTIEEYKSKCDLILVDTPGRNWKNKWELGQLNEFTKKDYVDEVQLILSMNMDSRDLELTIENFLTLNPDKLLLTKFDETSTFGDLINITKKYKKPYSYITFGQDVPEDIKPAQPDILVDYLLGDLDG